MAVDNEEYGVIAGQVMRWLALRSSEPTLSQELPEFTAQQLERLLAFTIGMCEALVQSLATATGEEYGELIQRIALRYQRAAVEFDS